MKRLIYILQQTIKQIKIDNDFSENDEKELEIGKPMVFHTHIDDVRSKYVITIEKIIE